MVHRNDSLKHVSQELDWALDIRQAVASLVDLGASRTDGKCMGVESIFANAEIVTKLEIGECSIGVHEDAVAFLVSNLHLREVVGTSHVQEETGHEVGDGHHVERSGGGSKASSS